MNEKKKKYENENRNRKEKKKEEMGLPNSAALQATRCGSVANERYIVSATRRAKWALVSTEQTGPPWAARRFVVGHARLLDSRFGDPLLVSSLQQRPPPPAAPALGSTARTSSSPPPTEQRRRRPSRPSTLSRVPTPTFVSTSRAQAPATDPTPGLLLHLSPSAVAVLLLRTDFLHRLL